MRAAVLFVAPIVMLAVPALGSKACLTQAEAHHKFGSTRLYWHGADHCWDKIANRHAAPAHHVRESGRAASPDNRPSEDRQGGEAPWRNAMSEMIPGDAARSAPTAQGDEAGPNPSWNDRWVDVAQIVPSELAGHKSMALALSEPPPSAPPPLRKVEPMVTPTSVIFAFLGLALTLAVIELLFRNSVRDRRK